MKFEYTRITPDMAKALLDSQAAAPESSNKIRQDIENGSFEMNGESIVLDSNGFLIDGRARLRTI